MQNGDESNKAGLEGGPAETVARTLIDSYTTEMRIAGHAAIADEPRDVGGNALGPSPYDYLAAALAACTSMTLKMYATRKGMGLESVTVRVTHARVHAGDCEHCESGAAFLDEFRRDIALEGDLADAERQRLLDIADKCPVHRTLHGDVNVVSRLVS
jgi:uncharacterized OsmC-like protein